MRSSGSTLSETRATSGGYPYHGGYLCYWGVGILITGGYLCYWGVGILITGGSLLFIHSSGLRVIKGLS